MKYHSTRNQIANSALSPAAALIQGLAPDGGLYVPVTFPKPNWELADLLTLSYQAIAEKILNLFFPDFTPAQIKQVVADAYADQWDKDEIVPLVKHAGNYYMELYHGPTLAFKDVALQVLPRLMTRSVTLERLDKDIVILTATSGDTGTASMRGFSDQAGTQVLVFYPYGGVSPVQLKQMLSQKGRNLQAFAIKGNFDDAQSEVKRIFNDEQFKDKLAAGGYQFSSANSMNIGRLMPQIVYYFYSYAQLVNRGEIKLGQAVNFAVPTGNFGDILAGYYAKKLGLPIHKLICASDRNNVLTDFFHTGTYNRLRPFYLTNSPAMDILVSSNLERLLFDVDGENDEEIKAWMKELDQAGRYQVSPEVFAKLQEIFASGYAEEDEVEQEIHRLYDLDGYVIDPHTAVGSFVTKQYQAVTGDTTPTIINSTASPYKFPETVFHAITGQAVAEKGLPAIKQLHTLLGGELPQAAAALFADQPRTEKIIAKEDMETIIRQKLNLK
ncbi:MAG: threonine synthase [Lactobacillus sp.]|jgi:threonine synthase|nr:threonine synthase [Lactobacillus sp.]MCH3906088.1 threonine synthase [Lactobacillus sp.]MCH3990337.1 threonine synthase [Lactobacillus sp.]MCH4068948.1 threonine synthase [Lactobacillus sp.]MCI1303350.1 threonine synthase [Lactobacillus sp.]